MKESTTRTLAEFRDERQKCAQILKTLERFSPVQDEYKRVCKQTSFVFGQCINCYETS